MSRTLRKSSSGRRPSALFLYVLADDDACWRSAVAWRSGPRLSHSGPHAAFFAEPDRPDFETGAHTRAFRSTQSGCWPETEARKSPGFGLASCTLAPVGDS
ncbi:hypothetical protein MTO96_001367 [Rhipicephalus appendiculatus]